MRARRHPARIAADLIARLPADAPVAIVRDRGRTIIGLSPSELIEGKGVQALSQLDRMTGGWWAGFVAYDLGRAIERVPEKNPPTGLPDVSFARFDTRIVIDDNGIVDIDGNDAEVDELLSSSAGRRRYGNAPHWRSSLDHAEYECALAAIREHLLAGDCYQVNLTRTLTADAALDAGALFQSLRMRHPAPHDALICLGDVAIVSASPESFLRVEGRRVTTRPIKGTSSDRWQLATSAKDRAENVMIVDLARNDLGRVCEYGSVRVRELFSLEEHPGLYHLVSTIDGELRDHVTLGDLIRATFPPASVTGCPKPRVVQIIEELEPTRRGVYCGAIGFVDTDRGVCDLSVAIRTFAISAGKTTFGVGGGIVADSDPGAEWEETELKARRLLEVAGTI